MRPAATKEKIKSTVDQFLSTVTSNTGPKRFHVTLRIGSKEFGVSVKCTPDGDTSVLTAFCDNEHLTLDHWKGASPEAFLNHDWVGANVLQVVPSKVTEEQVQQMLNQQPTCFVSYYEGLNFFKAVRNQQEIVNCFITVIDLHPPAAPMLVRRCTTTETVNSIWKKTISPLINDAAQAMHCAQKNNELYALSTHEKSQMARVVRDAFAHCDVKSFFNRATCLANHIRMWLADVCAPYVNDILAIEGNAELIINKIDAAYNLLDALMSFVDIVLWSADPKRQQKTQDQDQQPKTRCLCTAIQDGAREHLLIPCLQHIAKISLASIQECRARRTVSDSVINDDHFVSLMEMLPTVQYVDSIITPSRAAASDYFSTNAKEVMDSVRSEGSPHQYVDHVLRQLKVERDIAETLAYVFDGKLGSAFFSSYVGTSLDDESSLMKEALMTEKCGVASVLKELLPLIKDPTNVNSSDDRQRELLESLAVLLAGANLPVSSAQKQSNKFLAKDTFQEICKSILQAAVEKLFDDEHATFDTALQKQVAENQTEGSSVVRDYVMALIDTRRRLYSVADALETMFKGTSACAQLLRSANSASIWGTNIIDPVCPAIHLCVREGIISSLKKRSQETSTAGQDLDDRPISKEVEVCLAVFIDFVCKGLLKGADVIARVADAFALADHVVAKDTLQLELQNRCAMRLLANPSALDHDDLESTTINACKRVFGQNFVHKMEKNIADIQNRDKYNREFAEWPGNQGRALDASFLVLAAGQWGLSASTPWALPQAFQLAIDHFTMWFLSQHTAKKLDWIVSESTAECVVEFASKKDVFGPLSHIAVLLLLSGTGDAGLTLQQLCDAALQQGNALTPDKRLALMLKTVMDIRRCSKPPMLAVTAPKNGKKVDGSQRVSLVQKFVSPSRKFVVQSIAATKRVTTDEQLRKTREMLIESAIVRIMKSRRTLDFRQLYDEVVRQLVNHYSPVEREVKFRVEDLIQREYLKRDESDATRFDYLA
ncbi:cullin, putative [Bodo saltans]|uniref:Cullin, putative n=1 Tax=Bodo saltans TaxID=75058 RepID=A0A0S4JBH6_BODSA|nr:cullin, putative [Bodo saltans]|eukprot:CUG86787.1 cullin, putative [Bodo saltans]